MKRLILAGLAALAIAGCASQDAQTAAATEGAQTLRLGAGDPLGWQLQGHDRAITSASAEERDLAAHE
jgi:hypothetical protein